MDDQQFRPKSKRRRTRCVLVIVCVVILLLLLALILGLTLRSTSEHGTFNQDFLSRCEAIKGQYSYKYDCPKIWRTFEQAYVGKDPCMVPPEAYSPLLKAAPLEPACNRMLFWSKTKDVVHHFTEKRACHITMEDTLLGKVLDEQKWCGKEGSKETFTTNCPEWNDCDNNTVRSFWSKASASYAEVACGNVSVMLNGSIVTPFNPTSIFASIEVKHFNPAIMKSLNVVLVTSNKQVSNCTNASLKNLQKELAKGIAYSCQEVQESRVEECASSSEIPCGACW